MSITRISGLASGMAKLGLRPAGAAMILASLFVGNAVASESPVAALEIDGLFQKDGQGIYDQVFTAVKQQAGDIIQSQTVAPNRAFKDFEAGKVACLSPANTNADFYQFEFATTQSTPMSTAMVYVFTRAGSAPGSCPIVGGNSVST